MNKILVIATAFAICLGIVGYFRYENQRIAEPLQVDSLGQPTQGSKSAKVHVVTFQDFKCPGCKYFFDEIYPKIKSGYIDTGKIRYTIIPIAFLRGSEKVAHSALCVYKVSPQSFFPYVEILFHSFNWDDPDWASLENLKAYAERVPGIDPFTYKSCLKSSSSKARLDQNYKMARDLLGSRLSTPAVFVDGVEVRSFSYQAIKKIIDRKLWEKQHGLD